MRGSPFLALEFCAGGTLADKLRGGALPPSEAAELVETLAQAVDAIHQQGILHRDLKPSNVLLTVEGQLKIADFCLADTFVEAALTETGTILGTPAYMAPELASGKHHLVGRGTDIYSLGAILYECLTGQRPFVADTMMEMIQRVIDTRTDTAKSSSPGDTAALEAICLKCLHKYPRQRYATAAELAADLRRFPRTASPRGNRAVLDFFTKRWSFWDGCGDCGRIAPRLGARSASDGARGSAWTRSSGLGFRRHERGVFLFDSTAGSCWSTRRPVGFSDWRRRLRSAPPICLRN